MWTVWIWNGTAHNLTQLPFGVDLGRSMEQVVYADMDGDCAGDVVGVGHYHGNETVGSGGWHLTVWPRTSEGAFSSSGVRVELEGSGSHYVHLVDVGEWPGLQGWRRVVGTGVSSVCVCASMPCQQTWLMLARGRQWLCVDNVE